MLSRDTDVGGTTLETLARLMVAVAAAGNNSWLNERTSAKRYIYRLQGVVAGIKLTLIEDMSLLSLRGDGWKVDLSCDTASYRYDSFYLPAPAGNRATESSKVDTYKASIHNVQIKSANAFRHDMTILLMFESQWES